MNFLFNFKGVLLRLFPKLFGKLHLNIYKIFFYHSKSIVSIYTYVDILWLFNDDQRTREIFYLGDYILIYHLSIFPFISLN